MFYVEKWHRENKKPLTFLHIGPPVIVFLAFIGITIFSWQDARNDIKEQRSTVLSSNIHEAEVLIENRINVYEDILRAGVGLFNASASVSRSEWKRFVEIMEIDKRYPGIYGIGYTQLLKPSEVASHENANRDSVVPEYKVFPAGEREIYSSIVYIEPMTQANKKAIGYDMYSEENRRAAMDLARDSGDPAITDTVTLVQDNPNDKGTGLLMYLPVYRQGTPSDTLEERRANIIGFVYAPFRSETLIEKVTTSVDSDGFAFQIFDASQPVPTLLYESQDYQKINQANRTQQSFANFKVYNQDWIVAGIIDTTTISSNQNGRPTTILWGGILFSVFIAGFIYLLLLNRTRALASKEEFEIQNAKDELLALASHQLRTPATGVKQYLGLLREGYAGALNRDQRRFVNKAYESNERQLNTINEMLFVARSDAGNIKLTIRKLDFAGLIQSVIEEQKQDIKDKKHTLINNVPKTEIGIFGDEQYLRMAVENIISNAIKYTSPGGEIVISLKRLQDAVRFEVEDNGVGVNQRDLELLFKKFSRIPNELTSQVSGSGIGLYLTKSIVKAHGGQISFESVVNVGSSVVIKLPTKLPKEKSKV